MTGQIYNWHCRSSRVLWAIKRRDERVSLFNPKTGRWVGMFNAMADAVKFAAIGGKTRGFRVKEMLEVDDGH